MNHLSLSESSACVFGSSARSSTDALSDKDILITGKHLASLNPVIQELKKDGWSVAVFSHSRLERMAAAGSLFVQHLKLEGRSVWDSENWLENLLNGYTPKASYESDVVKSFDLIRPLERLMNPGPTSHLAADLGYVFIRNYAINRLASNGVFLFDYRSLIEELQGVQGFSDRCLQKLVELRAGKYSYRLGMSNDAVRLGGGEVAECISEACSEVRLAPIVDGAAIRRFGLNYATLRDCEAALVGNGVLLDSETTAPGNLGSVLKAIRNPREYSWRVRSIDDRWITLANRLVWGASSDPNQFGNTYLKTGACAGLTA